MNIVLFGATGHTGSYVLEELLKASHEVTALVRDASKLREGDNAKLHVITGDAMNYGDVLSVIKGKDAVISTISEGPSIKHMTQSIATGNMIKAMQDTGVRRILCMGASGILQFNANELIRDQPFYDDLYRPISFEHSSVTAQLADSSLDWTQVCPPTILAAPADGNFAVKADYPPTDKGEANAGNIGLFMVQELDQRAFIGKRVGITNL